ncbi:MAG TPA: family 2 encapsulin nanocompartment cargo protein terpene cyclase [Streptosporangiaceae bacterium]
MTQELEGNGLARLLAGPSGLGTSAFRLPGAGPDTGAVPNTGLNTGLNTGPGAGLGTVPAPAPAPEPGPEPGPRLQPGELSKLSSADLLRTDLYAPVPYVEREWGDGSYPPLYCPQTVRSNDDLADEVNRRLVAWAQEVGIYATQLDAFRDTGFGRLAVLTHSDSDDPDLLLLAAQMNAAWWAADDYYADDTELGATPTELPPRLSMIMAAIDPPPPAGDYTRQLDEEIQADPVLVALRSATDHLMRHATPAQVMRARSATGQMYVSWTAYAAWRYLEVTPAVWRYIAARQQDSFYTSMTLIDVVGGYELAANLFCGQQVRHAVMQAGMAAVIVNDLHSLAREAADELPDSNLVLLIAAEEDCSVREATERAVGLHNDFVRAFEASQRELAAVPSVELQRFLRGAQAWMGGGFEWHSTSSRYR